MNEFLSLSAPHTKRRAGKKWQMLLVVLCIAGVLFWMFEWMVVVDNGIVGVVEHPIIAQVNTTVTQLHVKTGEHVLAGQPVAQLDPTLFHNTAADANAKLSMLDHEVSGFAPSPAIRLAEQDFAAAAATARQAETQAGQEVNHLSTLHAQALLEVRKLDLSGARPETTSVQQARNNAVQAEQNLESARVRLADASRNRAAADAALQQYRVDMAHLQRNLKALPPEILARQQQLHTQRLREATQNIALCNVTAPISGKLSRVDVQQGERVRVGHVLGSIIPEDSLFITLPAQNARDMEGHRCYAVFPTQPKLTLWGRVNAPSTSSTTPDEPLTVQLHGYDPTTMPALTRGMQAKVYILPM